jgi:hypothetical protein
VSPDDPGGPLDPGLARPEAGPASAGPRGERLIFLLSQPRAGSTVLQRVLGSHPDVHTVSEPWLMLHPLYALRREGHEAEYNARTAHRALRSFLDALPGGEAEYLEAIRLLAGHLYGRALVASGRSRFLDKTPRYYLVARELVRIFPGARYVVLLRNPLAVLHSIVRTWIGDNWLRLAEYRADLLEAPAALLEVPRLAGAGAVTVHYEAFVRDPAAEAHRLCQALGLPARPEMVDYGRAALPRWRLGDSQHVHVHARPVETYADAWVGALGEPQLWRVARDYVEALGPELLAALGYPGDELRALLDRHRPAPARLWPTRSLAWLTADPPPRPAGWRRHLVRALGWARRRTTPRPRSAGALPRARD